MFVGKLFLIALVACSDARKSQKSSPLDDLKGLKKLLSKDSEIKEMMDGEMRRTTKTAGPKMQGKITPRVPTKGVKKFSKKVSKKAFVETRKMSKNTVPKKRVQLMGKVSKKAFAKKSRSMPIKGMKNKRAAPFKKPRVSAKKMVGKKSFKRAQLLSKGKKKLAAKKPVKKVAAKKVAAKKQSMSLDKSMAKINKQLKKDGLIGGKAKSRKLPQPKKARKVVAKKARKAVAKKATAKKTSKKIAKHLKRSAHHKKMAAKHTKKAK